jgi:hypothetical protein
VDRCKAPCSSDSSIVDWNETVDEKGRFDHQRSWIAAVVPPECTAVYQTYIAKPSKRTGLTLMWHGVSREWGDSQFLETIRSFGFDEIDFVYLPLNFWIRKQDNKGKRGDSREVRLKNKGYGFVHLSDASKEAEFSHKVATLSFQSGRVMYTTRATAQGVTNQLMQTIHVAKARSACRGMVHVRIEGELKSVSRLSLWQLHRKETHLGLAGQQSVCSTLQSPRGEEQGDESD